MAKKSSGGGGGESSNTGLIVTLVFFVLLAIGLGVSTYMGYGGKAEADKAAAAAAAKEKSADDKAAGEEARRLAIKIAAGVEDPADKARFAAIKSRNVGGVEGDVAQLYAQVETKLGVKNLTKWSPSAGDQPPKTLANIVDDLQKAAAAAATKEKAATDELNKERETFKEAVKELNAKLTTANDNLAKAHKALLDEQTSKSTASVQKSDDNSRLSEELKKLTLEKQNLEVEKDREIKKLRDQLDQSKKVRATLAEKYGPILERIDQVRQNRPEVRELGDLHDLLIAVLEGQQSLVNDTAKGSIVKTANGQVYINLGSADNARAGLTFSVLPAGATGRAAAAKPRKGAVEIVSVLEPHLSVAKVVEANNPARDPLLAGDLLFNPAWSPTEKQHVALAGIIDLNGDGVDDTADLIRALEKQGVVVDAYLDLRERAIKGPGMTERTTYLIKGERPVIPGTTAVTDNPLVQAATEIIGKMTEMEQKAQTLGVMPVQYRRFLSLIGYKLPKSVQPADYSSSSYLRGTTTGKQPGETNKEDKPK